MGRKSKLDDERKAVILESIRAGNYAETAAAAAGISQSTFYLWLQKGAAGEPNYSEFSEAVKEAEAIGEQRCVALITKAARRNWTAAAWMLERKHPERWGRREMAPYMPTKGETDTRLTISVVEPQAPATTTTLAPDPSKPDA